jgi:SHO1 osmosensor
MPSLLSPSLKNMDHSRASYGRRKGIQMGNILGDPFALATISIAIV